MNLLTCFSHMYPGSSAGFLIWHFMLLYFPFPSISPQCSTPKLFGSCVFQRHVPVDVQLTQALLSLTQHHVRDPLALFKPMNQRVFPSMFFVKFLTKCHSFSVSIETSEPFFWSLHFFLAALQFILSSWKVYLEQTVTNVYGKPTNKREKQKQGKMIYLLILIKPSDTQESFNIYYVAVGIGWTKLWISKIKSLHKSKNTWGVETTFPSLSIPCLMIWRWTWTMFLHYNNEYKYVGGYL